MGGKGSLVPRPHTKNRMGPGNKAKGRELAFTEQIIMAWLMLQLLQIPDKYLVGT